MTLKPPDATTSTFLTASELDSRTPEFHVNRYLTSSDPVQAAVTAAGAAGGGEVVLPGNVTFSRSTTLNWAQDVTMRGEGSSSIIAYTGSGVAIQFGSGALDVTTWTRLRIRDIALTGTSSATSGIKVRGATRWMLDNLTISGFTTGSGILLNGASFIGKINGGRITTCDAGISAQKQAGDGAAGAGQAFNAIEVCGQIEIQDNNYGILLGNRTTNETLPIVGMGANIHDCTIESNDIGGIWNVSAYRIGINNVYFESNATFDVRVGSTSGNTIVPIKTTARDNDHYVFTTAYDILRADSTEIIGNRLDGNASGTCFALASTAVNTKVQRNRPANVTTVLTDASFTTQYEPHDQRITIERISAWLDDTLQTATLGILPANALIKAVGILVTEAWNSSGTDEIRIGGTGNNNRYAAVTDVTTTGNKTPAAGSSVTPPAFSTGGDTVTTDYVNGGTEPTTGKALVWMEYTTTASQPA